jgi:hypothetical protein
MNFNSDGNPTVTALYLVNRDKQGKAYRWYNAETDQWGMCGIDMQAAVDNKDKTAVGFFPWVGPLTGPNFDTNKTIVWPQDGEPTKAPKAKAAKAPAKQRMAKSKLVISQVGNTKVGTIVKQSGKVQHPDGTVFYRGDRGKWIAMWNGKQEAARPTAEACLAFLLKKYNHTGVVIPKE